MLFYKDQKANCRCVKSLGRGDTRCSIDFSHWLITRMVFLTSREYVKGMSNYKEYQFSEIQKKNQNFAACMLANQTLWWIMQGGPGADPHRFPPFHWKRSDFWNCAEANIFYFFLRIKVNSQVHADFQSQQHRKYCFRVKSQQFSGETLAPLVLAKLENGPIFSWICAWGPSCACLTIDPPPPQKPVLLLLTCSYPWPISVFTSPSQSLSIGFDWYLIILTLSYVDAHLSYKSATSSLVEHFVNVFKSLLRYLAYPLLWSSDDIVIVYGKPVGIRKLE